MRELEPTQMTHHAKATVNVPVSLEKTTHVFVGTDAVRPPLVRPYTGPYRVISKSAKFFTIEKNGKTDTVSVDRLKPAFTHQNKEKTDDVMQKAGDSKPISDKPESPPMPRKRGRPRKSYSEALQTPTEVQTRSGRISRKPDRT